jgi:hypothetical protein
MNLSAEETNGIADYRSHQLACYQHTEVGREPDAFWNDNRANHKGGSYDTAYQHPEFQIQQLRCSGYLVDSQKVEEGNQKQQSKNPGTEAGQGCKNRISGDGTQPAVNCRLDREDGTGRKTEEST